MRHDILERQLELLAMLTQNRKLSQSDICDSLQITPRTYYRYLEAFERMGFIIRKEGKAHRVDRSSPFFRRITELIHFTETEAVTLRNVLDSVNNHSPEITYLREKLSRLYDGQILQNIQANPLFAANLHQLYEAIKLRRTVILHDYYSTHSDTKTNRVVEPFQFLAGNEDVRCYEPSSGTCKTFKVERMARVTLLDLNWSFQDRHKTYFTDCFHFSSEDRTPVSLRLSHLAGLLLQEEYPSASSELTPDGDGWLWNTYVCSWKGIGRFVLGLPNDVEVLSPADFLTYLRSQPHF